MMLNTDIEKATPDFMKSLSQEQIIALDVRPILATGTDPFKVILEKTKEIEEGQALKIINTFKPAPLITLLERQGFISYTEVIDSNLVETYFYKPEKKTETKPLQPNDASIGWDEILEQFSDHLVKIDVRNLEMPQPMHIIIEALDKLPPNQALFIYHQRLPVFLLPELAEMKFEFRIKEVSAEEVWLLIFRA
ncbi:MAG: DUF2249 domain-containing protein [Bacteroidetes bacterium]|nr:DUF2249 domain-containing protein [Bacteroidota bacterium]